MASSGQNIVPADISTTQVIKRIASVKGAPPNKSTLRNSAKTPEELATHAVTILRSIPDEAGPTASSRPETLQQLLSTIIKPLFSVLKNPSLSASGRKNLVSTPNLTENRFNTISPLDEASKPWKFAAPWSIPLLVWVVSGYGALSEEERANALDAHFPLLVPPILSLIDDDEVICKAQGCALLEQFTSYLANGQRSNLLERTGLADVFIDALVPNMSLLPTLTPEDESMLVLGALYPAFRALITARFPTPASSEATTTTTTLSRTKDQTPSQPSSHTNKTTLPFSFTPSPRQNALNALLRHGLLRSFPYTLDSSTPHLTTLLLNQLTLTLPLLGIDVVRYLREIIPLLRRILADPFAVARGPATLRAGLRALKELLNGECRERIGVEVEGDGEGRKVKGWAIEVLRICIGCWEVAVDEEKENMRGAAKGQNSSLKGPGESGKAGNDAAAAKGNGDLETVKAEIRQTVQLLREVAPDLDQKGYVQTLLETDEGSGMGLKELFGVAPSSSDQITTQSDQT